MEMSSAKWPSFCIGLSVLQIKHNVMIVGDTGLFYPIYVDFVARSRYLRQR